MRKCISNPFFPTNTRYILSLNLLPFYLSTFLPLITPVPIFARHQAPCIIHVHSTFSENGKRSIEEIVVKARDRGIKVLILSDHDLMKWEYGIFPLRKIIKKKVEKNSVLLIGADKFLKEIERVQKKYPDILIIPGIESSPFYWWSGSPFKGDLTLNGWNKHLLIAGLYKKQDYENLPLVGNTTASRIDVIKFWPLLLVFTGILTGIKKRGGLFLIVLGFSFLVYNYPFSTFEFNQYNGDRVELPYQRVIDYVNEKGGVTFWAHPEAPNYEIPVKVGKISVRTNRYPESILKTFNYTGFAYFWEGNEIVGSPGGYWDRTLTDYCRNTRDKPVWAISELDYTDDGANNTWLGLNKNILYLEKFTQNDVLESFRKGSFYVISKNSENDFEPVLDKYVKKDRTVIFRISSSDKKEHTLVIRIIEMGKTVETLRSKVPFYIEHKLKSAGETYCRIEVDLENSSKLVTNPLFFAEK